MKITIPVALYDTIETSLLYNVLKESERIPHFPSYNEKGELWFSGDCIRAISKMPVWERAEIGVEAIFKAQEIWRKSLRVQRLLLDDDCFYSLNAALCSELAGFRMFSIRARELQLMLGPSGFFDNDRAFAPEGFEKQLAQMEEFYFEHSPMLSNAYLIKRRKYVEQKGITDEGELRKYISQRSNDVFGVIYETQECSAEERNVRYQIMRKAYDDIATPYQITRQTLLANGGETPVYW